MRKGVIERVKILIEQSCKGNKSAFARQIDVPLSTFKNYLDLKRTDIVSVEALLRMHETTNVNITWILTGKGEMYLNEEQQKEDFDIDDVLVHLTEEQRQEIMTRTQEMRLMNALKQRVDGLEHHIDDLEKRLDTKE